MKNQNIFKEKLYNHTSPVREGLWDAIEAQLPPKKEDNVFPLFWFTLFASTLLGGALMFGAFHKNQSNIPLPITSNPLTEHKTIENIIANIESPQSSPINTNASPPSFISSSNHVTRSTSVADVNNVNNTTSNNKTSTNKSTSSTGPKPKKAIDKASLETYPYAQTANIKLNKPSKKRSSSITSFLPPANMYAAPDVLAQLEITAHHTDPNCYKFSGNTDKYAISADIFAGPGFGPRSFEDTAGESSIYADARKATEHGQYGWSAGGRVNLLFRNGFGARLGLTYTQVGDLFDYTDTLATQKSVRYDSFFGADGAFLYVDTVRFLRLGTLIKKIHNTYRYLDIPLLASFELPLGRSIFMINAGPVFNLTSSHEGQILDSNLHPATITPGESGEIPVYKTNLGLSIYMGAGVVFPISDHISGLVEPSFLYRLKPVTLDSYPLKEHRHYASLNLGIRYHFD